jgi:hypothetical protein
MRSCSPNTGFFEQPAVCDSLLSEKKFWPFTTCYIATSAFAQLLSTASPRLSVCVSMLAVVESCPGSVAARRCYVAPSRTRIRAARRGGESAQMLRPVVPDVAKPEGKSLHVN